MTHTIPAALIRRSYLLPCSVNHAAAIVSKKCGHRISGPELKRLWDAQCEQFAPMRMLGERPEDGFQRATQAEIDKLDFCEAFIKAMPKEQVAA